MEVLWKTTEVVQTSGWKLKESTSYTIDASKTPTSPCTQSFRRCNRRGLNQLGPGGSIRIMKKKATKCKHNQKKQIGRGGFCSGFTFPRYTFPNFLKFLPGYKDDKEPAKGADGPKTLVPLPIRQPKNKLKHLMGKFLSGLIMHNKRIKRAKQTKNLDVEKKKKQTASSHTTNFSFLNLTVSRS